MRRWGTLSSKSLSIAVLQMVERARSKREVELHFRPHQLNFNFGLLPCGSQMRPRASGYFKEQIKINNCNTHLRLINPIVFEQRCLKLKQVQLLFPFMADDLPGNVVRLATKCQHAYLDHGIYDMLRQKGLSKSTIAAAHKLSDNFSIFYIGQLVQLDETEFRSLPFVTPRVFDEFKGYLKSINLDFNMPLPSWNRSLPKSLPVSLNRS